MSLREKYLSATCAVATYDVPQWGPTCVRSLSLQDVEKFEKAEPIQAVVLAVLHGVCDEHGNRVFTDQDHDAVCSLPFEVLRGASEAVGRHNKLTAQDVADEKNA